MLIITIYQNKIFKQIKMDFAEHTLYNNWYYGIAKEDCIDIQLL